MEALHLLQQPGTLLVQTCVLYRGGGDGGENDRHVLVLLGERLAADLLGQIKVAEHAAAADDRHTQERVHRRMVRRETVGIGVLGEIGKTNRPRIPDHEAENPVTAGWGTDEGPQLVA